MDHVAPACRMLDLLGSSNMNQSSLYRCICTALRQGKLAEAQLLSHRSKHLHTETSEDGTGEVAAAILVEGVVAHAAGELGAAQHYYTDACNNASTLDSPPSRYICAVACLGLGLVAKGYRNWTDALRWCRHGLNVAQGVDESYAQVDRLRHMLNRFDQELQELIEQDHTGQQAVNSLPIIGTSAGGVPRCAELVEIDQARWNDLVLDGCHFQMKRNIESNWAVSSAMRNRGRYLAARVEGDSMQAAGITSGDYVIFREQEQVEQGDIVIVRIVYLDDIYSTIKRLYRRDGKIVLRAANPQFQPQELVFDKSDPIVTILGKVVAVAAPVAVEI